MLQYELFGKEVGNIIKERNNVLDGRLIYLFGKMDVRSAHLWKIVEEVYITNGKIIDKEPIYKVVEALIGFALIKRGEPEAFKIL